MSEEVEYPVIRLFNALLVLVAILLGGTAGFMLIEGWTFLDAIYMTVISLTTVGFQEVNPLTEEGKVFTMLLVIGGMGTMAYTAFVMTQLLVERQLRLVLGRSKMDRHLDEMKDHVVVCGHGRVGSHICTELQTRQVPFVVIDRDPDDAGVRKGMFFVRGDATEEDVLLIAHVERAKSLITALPHDAENVFITITARQLNPKIFITSRAESERMEPKLKRAGADRVVCPHRTGARRMAIATLQPMVLDFMDIATGEEGPMGFRLDELKVGAGSWLAGRTLREIGLRPKYELSVIAIKRREGLKIMHPGPDERIEEGDILLLVGSPERLNEFDQLAHSKDYSGFMD